MIRETQFRPYRAVPPYPPSRATKDPVAMRREAEPKNGQKMGGCPLISGICHSNSNALGPPQPYGASHGADACGMRVHGM
eukprot:s319_g24.t1